MKLYVTCRHCNDRIYINSPARNRSELPFQFSLQCLGTNCHFHGNVAYSRNDVFAETDRNGALSGAIILGGLGFLSFGIIGGLIGGGAGLLYGSSIDNDDVTAVRVFNNST